MNSYTQIQWLVYFGDTYIRGEVVLDDFHQNLERRGQEIQHCHFTLGLFKLGLASGHGASTASFNHGFDFGAFQWTLDFEV